MGLGQEALCGNGKIPSGSLGLQLISSDILLVGLGGGSLGRASFVVYGGLLLFWYGVRFNSRRSHVCRTDSVPDCRTCRGEKCFVFHVVEKCR